MNRRFKKKHNRFASLVWFGGGRKKSKSDFAVRRNPHSEKTEFWGGKEKGVHFVDMISSLLKIKKKRKT